MHKVADWTSLHSTTRTETQAIMQAWSANAVVSEPTHWPFQSTPSSEEIDQRNFLDNKVKPAFDKALGVKDEFEAIRVLSLSESNERRPHARFWEDDRRVSIYLDWNGTPADAICLAHEMGHAAHYMMSDVNEIPPVARETTWQAKPDNSQLSIAHQSARFGDHLKLVRTLQQRIADAGPVSTISQRSARKEQLAW